MARYRHYKCLIEPKMTGFFTTTCLDFNHAISRDSLKTIALATVCGDCIFYGAPLHAFAIYEQSHAPNRDNVAKSKWQRVHAKNQRAHCESATASIDR